MNTYKKRMELIFIVVIFLSCWFSHVIFLLKNHNGSLLPLWVLILADMSLFCFYLIHLIFSIPFKYLWLSQIRPHTKHALPSPLSSPLDLLVCFTLLQNCERVCYNMHCGNLSFLCMFKHMIVCTHTRRLLWGV